MLVVAAKAGLGAERVAELLPRDATIPFSSDRQYMATLHRDTTAGHPPGHVVLAKGAVERVLDLCGAQMDTAGTVHPLARGVALRAADDLAGRGLRVLATAMRPAADPDEFDPDGFGPDAFGEDTLPGSLVLTGLQAMLDPPRTAATAAVAACHTAGIAGEDDHRRPRRHRHRDR